MTKTDEILQDLKSIVDVADVASEFPIGLWADLRLSELSERLRDVISDRERAAEEEAERKRNEPFVLTYSQAIQVREALAEHTQPTDCCDFVFRWFDGLMREKGW